MCPNAKPKVSNPFLQVALLLGEKERIEKEKDADSLWMKEKTQVSWEISPDFI